VPTAGPGLRCWHVKVWCSEASCHSSGCKSSDELLVTRNRFFFVSSSVSRQYLVVSVGIGAYAREAAKMVQDDGQIGHGLGKGGQFGLLREAHPNVEGVG
jgi:hypothetical protein